MTIYDEQEKKWKIGNKGKAIYNSQREANQAYLDKMVERINKAKANLNKALHNN